MYTVPEGNVLQYRPLLIVREADVLELDLALSKGERRGPGLVLREGPFTYDVYSSDRLRLCDSDKGRG